MTNFQDLAQWIESATADDHVFHAFADFDKSAEDRKPTVAVDLDGTLAKMYDEFDPEKIEDPRRGARLVMQELRDAGYRLIIFTVRGDKQLVADWCDKHDIPYDYINENPDQPADASGKVIADFYIDDRAVDARKSWRGIKQEIKDRSE